MALPGVIIKRSDGNIGTEDIRVPEQFCGMLFDVSQQTDFFTKNANLKDVVLQFESQQAMVDSKALEGVLAGIPMYHVNQFYSGVGGTGPLYVAFTDKTDWSCLLEMQEAAEGMISQFGIWTERKLWKKGVSDADNYELQIVNDLQAVLNSMANDLAAPAVAILNANTALVEGCTVKDGGREVQATTVDLNKIPFCVGAESVAISLGEQSSTEVLKMQKMLESKTPVGNLGVILSLLASRDVATNIGSYARCNLASFYVDTCLGFGDVSLEGDAPADGQEDTRSFKNVMRYAAQGLPVRTALDAKGYIIYHKYPGEQGKLFFNGDRTCSTGDYCYLNRNRAINKSRRLVRKALLPYVNEKFKVDPATGRLSAAVATILRNAVTTPLQAMVNANELTAISLVNIPTNQNVLKTSHLSLSYSVIPVGYAKTLSVTEGFALSQGK